MNPAFSVIFLTVFCGLGQGLFAMVLIGHLLGAQLRFLMMGTLAALALCCAGLAASFFHLGRPERAWRAVAQLRTSWLSREVIALPVFMAATAAYGLAVWLEWPGAFMLGLFALCACVALWVCTGMIYICIAFVQEWATPLTMANFVLLGLASGATLAINVSLFSDWGMAYPMGWLSVLFTAAAAIVRAVILARNARLKPKSTLQTAIGVRDDRIAQRSIGVTGGTFNTREFFHGRTRGFVRSVKWLFIALTFAVPLALMLLALAGAPAFFVLWAFVAQAAGLLFERWFFFAQARHPQNLYYQVVS